jgi:hypothetical protein
MKVATDPIVEVVAVQHVHAGRLQAHHGARRQHPSGPVTCGSVTCYPDTRGSVICDSVTCGPLHLEIVSFNLTPVRGQPVQTGPVLPLTECVPLLLVSAALVVL